MSAHREKAEDNSLLAIASLLLPLIPGVLFLVGLSTCDIFSDGLDVGCLLALIGYFGLVPVAVLGFTLGFIGMQRAEKGGSGGGLARAGIALNTIIGITGAVTLLVIFAG